MVNNILSNIDTIELAKCIKEKQLSPLEAVMASIKRIEDVNPKLNAVIYKQYDAAIEMAKNLSHL